jgi:hypothetical protein
MQGTPAGFPSGIPGMGELMDGAIQHAPQCFLQSIEILDFQDIFNKSKVTIYKINVKLLTWKSQNRDKLDCLKMPFLVLACPS